jgi:hypothetical protein
MMSVMMRRRRMAIPSLSIVIEGVHCSPFGYLGRGQDTMNDTKNKYDV